MEKNFIISQSLLLELIGYLQKRPYQEVAQAIPALMQLQEFVDPLAHDNGHSDSDVYNGVTV